MGDQGPAQGDSSTTSQYHINISPPLLNSANPWATTQEDLLSLYDSPYTGAVTIRTSLLDGFTQSASTHQYTFFSASTGYTKSNVDSSGSVYAEGRGAVIPGETSSLNTLGYSPIPFGHYLNILHSLARSQQLTRQPMKPFIVSVTGSADEVQKCYLQLVKLHNDSVPGLDLMMEINLSCPNIPDKAPPAYDGWSLAEYISAVSVVQHDFAAEGLKKVHVGIKSPPYTYHDQFVTLIESIESRVVGQKDGERCPISFITATNTLGSCLVLNQKGEPALGSATGTGIGGMAGDALHALALGNVRTIRSMLDASNYESVRTIAIIGVGGVGDADGYQRMRSVGAMAVGVGTALGREGVGVFEKISR